MNSVFSSIVKNKIIASVVLLILGIILLIAPSDAMQTYVRVIGAVLLVGAAAVIIAFCVSPKEKRSVLSLILSVTVAIIGLIFVCAPKLITGFLPFIFGAILLVNSAIDLISAIRLPFGKLIGILLAVIGIALGALIVSNPNALASFITRIIGVTLIFDGAAGMVTAALVKRSDS